MSTDPSAQHDERSVAVENASYRWACQVLSFGILASACYRSYAYHQNIWDLLLLVVLGGGVVTAYQARRQVLTRRWAITVLLAFVGAAVVAAAIAWIIRLSH